MTPQASLFTVITATHWSLSPSTPPTSVCHQHPWLGSSGFNIMKSMVLDGPFCSTCHPKGQMALKFSCLALVRSPRSIAHRPKGSLPQILHSIKLSSTIFFIWHFISLA